jgi:serine protease Do
MISSDQDRPAPAVEARGGGAPAGLSFRGRCGAGWIATAFIVVASSGRAEVPDLPTPPAMVIEAQQRRIAAIERATESTIGIFGMDGQGGGSGVIISADGYALTNFHVTDPFGDRMRCGLKNGQMYEAVIVGIDPTGDLALIKLEGRSDFPAAKLADSDRVQAGEWCFAAGNPFVLATNLQPTVTWGIVSGVHRYQYPSGTILEYTDCIQTDAAINPGNSGGPLYNAQGELIGINGRCSFEKRGRVNVGVGYAISINQAKLFLGHLKSGRIVDHATLGFTVGSDQGRVVVSNILESCDAYRRGVRYEDEILRLDGREVTSVNQFKNILGIFPSYSRLSLQFRRDGKILETWIRVTPLHTAEELEEIVQGQPVEVPRSEKKPPPAPREADVPGQAEESQAVDALAGMLEKRRGFANYFFNRRELERVLEPAKQPPWWGASANAVWSWRGQLAGEATPFQVDSAPDRILSKFGDEAVTTDPQRGWGDLIRQRSPHGMSLALRLWQRWHSQGPRSMGEATYLGTVGVPDRPGFVDLTQVTVDEVEVFFYADPASGEMVRIEIEFEADRDRLEVAWESKPAGDGGTIPSRIRAGYGPETQWTVDLEPLVLAAATGDSL